MRTGERQRRAVRRDQHFRIGIAFGRRNGFGFGDDMRWQAFALLDIEHDKAFQERNDIRRLAAFGGALAFGFGNETVGVTDRGALLAAPHMSAEVQGLAKGQPFLRCETTRQHRVPQDQHVDPRIEFAARGTPRHAKRRGVDAPRLDPRHRAFLQLANDAVRNVLIEIGAALAACGLLGRIAHLVPPARTSRPQFPQSGGGRRLRPERPAVRGGAHPQGRSAA